MTVLVTGATGYIGRRAALRLVGDGRNLRLVCRDPRRLDAELSGSRSVEVVVGDVSDEVAMRQACAGISGVLHLAAGTSGSAEVFDRSTISGTRAVFEAATIAGVTRFVYVSSMSVYDYSGMPPDGIVDEGTPLEAHPDRRNDYARSKRAAEAIVAEHMRRGAVKISVVRPGIVYGPGARDPLTAVNSLRHLGGKMFALVGDGRRQVPLVYVDNLVDALVLLLDDERSFGRVYNVIDTEPPSERDYLDGLRRVTGDAMTIVPVPTWLVLPLARGAELYRRARGRDGMDIVHGLKRVTAPLRFDAGALQRELGWRSRVALGDGLTAAYGGRSASGSLARAHAAYL